jgi:PIN domain nuclease of toxin-antitoxin system
VSTCVLDASALLALLNKERGSEQVAQAITTGAAISFVNLSEVVAKLSEAGMPKEAIYEVLALLALEQINFEAEQAYMAGMLRLATKHAGLSLGDRACLALAKRLNLPALTTDKAWESLDLDVTIQVVR